MIGHKEFSIICTNNGQHPSRQLTKFAPEPPRDEHGVWVGNSSEIGLKWQDWDLIESENGHGKVVYAKHSTHAESAAGRTWRFNCPSCTRDLQMTDARLGQLVLGFIDSDLRTFDISTRG